MRATKKSYISIIAIFGAASGLSPERSTMPQLFEYIDTLNSPYEAFWVDSHNINDPTRPHWHYYVEVIYVEIGELYAECDDKKAVLHPVDKNTRASNLEKVIIQKDLELNKKDTKEISKQISILLLDIKSTKSAIFDYNVKIGKIRKELNKNLGVGDNLSSEVQYLINRFGKK